MRRWLMFVVIVSELLISSADRSTAAETVHPDIYLAILSPIHITPSYPIRLGGFGFRRTESEGVTQPIFAKALALSHPGSSESLLLITVDSLGIPAAIRDQVANRLQQKIGLSPSHLAITATHSHTTPLVSGYMETLFGQTIPPEHRANIDRYTGELLDQLEKVAIEAFEKRQPARLSWGIGRTGFAINRRTKGGPVDHDLPVLVVKNLQGQTQAIYTNYACHCVTLSDNKIGGDWAGYAQDLIERENPGAISLVSIGCGADQNPSPAVTGGQVEFAIAQGQQVAAEVKRLLGGFLAPVQGAISTTWTTLPLEFELPRTSEQLKELAQKSDAKGFQAQTELARRTQGRPDSNSIDYSIQTWSFGSSLCLVFLPGEVVVDYALRLKKELDGRRLWINAYANDVPCYIPSERILKEGGYEAADSMIYYDRPGRLKSGLENQIISTIHQQIEPQFLPPFDPNKTNGSAPKSPHQSLATLQTTSNLTVDLVLSEPLISDPVAIDFGLDGSLWVAEMCDYPMGLPDETKTHGSNNSEADMLPGGQVRRVRDCDGDGQFDTSTVFLDKIPFPTGITTWGNGVLVCAAPNIFYAEDTDGDDHADIVKVLYSGFRDNNIQARVNSLVYGLDGWVYGSCGLAGGTITNFKGEKLELGDRDFRFKPDTGEIEPATGQTQQGRVRDDFGHWFGCDNLNMAFHYPLAEHYLRRNPFVVPPASRFNLLPTEESRKLYPAKADAQRFQLSGAPGTVTAACGAGVYRDTKLGPEYSQNLFVCEPVNLLVHRMVLKPSGPSFVATRPELETQTEFLRSSDGWFRPVQAITGPDGTMWIVDMYRFIIEDPRWIPDDELAPLDVRAGAGMGRIYRVRNRSELTPPSVAYSGTRTNAGGGHNPTSESAVYRELEIQRVAKEHANAAVRTGEVHPVAATSDVSQRLDHYRTLVAGGRISAADVVHAIQDDHPGIQCYGLMLAEQRLSKEPLPETVIAATHSDVTQVRLQAAYTLGAWKTPKVGELLAEMAVRDADDPYLVAAIFSSLTPETLASFSSTLTARISEREPPATLMPPFLATAVGYSDNVAIRQALQSVDIKDESVPPKAWQFNAITSLLDALSKQTSRPKADPAVEAVIQRLHAAAARAATAENSDDDIKLAAINLLGREEAEKSNDTQLMTSLLSSVYSPAIQTAAVEALERIATDDLPAEFLQRFRDLSPSVQPRLIDVFLNRANWIDFLFEGIADGRIPTTAITAAQRQEMVGHPDNSIRERATKLIAGSINSNRQQVIQQYREALELTGNPAQGKVVFSKTCSQCHRLGDIGHSVGPNLAMIASKPPAFVLQEVLDPNKNVDARYTAYVAVTKSGTTRTGILSSESSTSITLLNAEEKKFTLLRQELDELRATGKSLMPEGLEKDLTPQNVADLISFLLSVPALSKHFDGNTPATVNLAKGRLDLLANNASIIGDQITFEKQFGNIGYWRSLQDHVFWTVNLTEPAQFDAYLDYSCAPDSAGNGYILESNNASLSGHIKATGGWDKFVTAPLGKFSLAAGQHRIVLRPDGAAMSGALADVRGIYLVPAGEPLALAPMPARAESEDIKSIARQLLDDSLTEEQKIAVTLKHPTLATDLVVEMTSDLPDDTNEEYRRIPWIWRVAVECGKRDQTDQLRSLLNVSLPKPGQPLKDWQSVVVGGGIINGIGLKGGWPKTRMDELLKDNPDLTARWQQTLDQSSAMTENEKVNTGTRYDAMRIIALDARKERRDQLLKYLPKGTHEELQMGAVSGLSDIDSPEVAPLLIANVVHFNEENRDLAVAALTRLDSRAMVLLDAIANGNVPLSLINQAERTKLIESKNSTIRERAKQLLSK